MENNSQNDNAIVYAWINLSVGKKQKSTRGSEMLMQMLLLDKVSIFLTCQSIPKLK